MRFTYVRGASTGTPVCCACLPRWDQSSSRAGRACIFLIMIAGLEDNQMGWVNSGPASNSVRTDLGGRKVRPRGPNVEKRTAGVRRFVRTPVLELFHFGSLLPFFGPRRRHDMSDFISTTVPSQPHEGHTLPKTCASLAMVQFSSGHDLIRAPHRMALAPEIKAGRVLRRAWHSCETLKLAPLRSLRSRAWCRWVQKRQGEGGDVQWIASAVQRSSALSVQ